MTHSIITLPAANANSMAYLKAYEEEILSYYDGFEEEYKPSDEPQKIASPKEDKEPMTLYDFNEIVSTLRGYKDGDGTHPKFSNPQTIFPCGDELNKIVWLEDKDRFRLEHDHNVIILGVCEECSITENLTQDFIYTVAYYEENLPGIIFFNEVSDFLSHTDAKKLWHSAPRITINQDSNN